MFDIFPLFHYCAALQEFATTPATCAESSKVIVDGAIEKNLCYVKSSLTAYKAKMHCKQKGMQLYRPNSSPQAWEALVAFANKSLHNNKRIQVLVDGRSGDICTALQGNGELKNISCKLRSFFVCEFIERTKKISCATSYPVDYNNGYNTTGITSPEVCYYNSTISNGNTAITVNSGNVKENIFEFLAPRNPAIKYLPVDFASSFPNLHGIVFYECSISEISYRSLKGLFKLLYLSLAGNNISKLDGEVFKDLVIMTALIMGKLSNFYSFLSEFHFIPQF
jgi:hypothetical protein